MPDTGRSISDEEDEELQELMRQGTEDVLVADEFTPADVSCQPESAASVAKTPNTPKSDAQVLLTCFKAAVNVTEGRLH